MTLLPVLLAHFSRRFGTIYYEGMCPADAPFPYGILSLQVPAAFEGDGQAALTFYERGKDSHSLIASLFAEEATRDDHALLPYAGGLAMLRRKTAVICREKNGVSALRLTYIITLYPNGELPSRKEVFAC